MISRRPQARWFVVKTVFQSYPTGKPMSPDRSYIPGVAAVETRIVLVRAPDHEAAAEKAVAQARAYAADERVNVYGQRIVTKYLEAYESYELLEESADGVEVYSATFVTPVRESRSAILRRTFDQRMTPLRRRAARMFFAEAISRRLDAVLGKGWEKRPFK